MDPKLQAILAKRRAAAEDPEHADASGSSIKHEHSRDGGAKHSSNSRVRETMSKELGPQSLGKMSSSKLMDALDEVMNDVRSDQQKRMGYLSLKNDIYTYISIKHT
jgi:hypothetical protein